MSTAPRTKIYGERNTGTNYLAELVETNLDTDLYPGVAPRRVIVRGRDEHWRDTVGTNAWARLRQRRIERFFDRDFAATLGWKHSAPALDRLREHAAPGTRFLTLSKNPYSWLLSLHRRPYQFVDVPERFEDFITLPWQALPRENLPSRPADPVDLWNLKNASYGLLRDWARCVNLTYERLIQDPDLALSSAAATLDLDSRSTSFVNLETSTKNEDESFASYREYYLEERWRSLLTRESVELINARLDESVMRAFGYALIDP